MIAVNANQNTTAGGWALITGASFGIGQELAALLAQKKYNLILVARTESKLKSLADVWAKQFNVKVQTIALDLTAPAASQRLLDEVRTRGLHIDVLVNNAGFGSLGSFLEEPLENTRQMIQLNITVLTELTYFFANEMAARRTAGYILNVASIAGFLPGPLMAIYYASKAFVLHFSEAVNEEFCEKGISVTALCPGPTPTEFQKRAGMDQSGLALMATSKERVARAGLDALFARKAVVIPGFFNWLTAFFVRLAPRFLAPKMVKWIQKKRS